MGIASSPGGYKDRFHFEITHLGMTVLKWFATYRSFMSVDVCTPVDEGSDDLGDSLWNGCSQRRCDPTFNFKAMVGICTGCHQRFHNLWEKLNSVKR